MIDQFIAKYGKRLYGLCVALCAGADRCAPDADADDLYQETWLKVCAKIDRYDASKSFEGWLTQICVNTYRDHLRRRRISPFFNLFASNEEKDAAMAQIPAPASPDYGELHRAVNRLPEKYRTVVILHYFSEFDVKATADALKIPPGTVKSRLSRARELLKEMLDDAFDF